jgi:type I restriction enzyme M protein
MTHIIFDPIKNNLPQVMTIYDPTCRSVGILTEAQNFIKDEAFQQTFLDTMKRMVGANL